MGEGIATGTDRNLFGAGRIRVLRRVCTVVSDVKGKQEKRLNVEDNLVTSPIIKDLTIYPFHLSHKKIHLILKFIF